MTPEKLVKKYERQIAADAGDGGFVLIAVSADGATSLSSDLHPDTVRELLQKLGPKLGELQSS